MSRSTNNIYKLVMIKVLRHHKVEPVFKIDATFYSSRNPCMSGKREGGKI